jgi:small-conductance mechanosensitive channel
LQWHRRSVAAVASLRPAAAAAAFSDARELIVRPNFRRAIVAAIVFVVASAVAVGLGGVHAKHTVFRDGQKFTEAYRSHQLGSAIAIVVCAVAGLATARLIANEIWRLANHRGSAAAASALRLTTQIIGYLIVVIVVLGLLAVRVQSVLLSGAIGSVVIGLAAQQSLSNAFAGIVLLISRPFIVGDYITLRAGALGGQYDGEIVGITLMFTMMETTEGPMSFPNAAVLSAGVGRRQRPGGSTPPLIR